MCQVYRHYSALAQAKKLLYALMFSLTIKVFNPLDISKIFHFTLEIWPKMWKISELKMDRASAQCFLKFLRFYLKLLSNFFLFLCLHIISFTKKYNLAIDHLKSLLKNYANLAGFTKFNKKIDVVSNWGQPGTVKKLMEPQFLVSIFWYMFYVQ